MSEMLLHQAPVGYQLLAWVVLLVVVVEMVGGRGQPSVGKQLQQVHQPPQVPHLPAARMGLGEYLHHHHQEQRHLQAAMSLQAQEQKHLQAAMSLQ
jgi:hypothetical protein